MALAVIGATCGLVVAVAWPGCGWVLGCALPVFLLPLLDLPCHTQILSWQGLCVTPYLSVVTVPEVTKSGEGRERVGGRGIPFRVTVRGLHVTLYLTVTKATE